MERNSRAGGSSIGGSLLLIWRGEEIRFVSRKKHNDAFRIEGGEGEGDDDRI